MEGNDTLIQLHFSLDLHRKSLQIVKPFLNLSQKPADCKSFTLWLSFYLFLFFFYSSHHSDTVSPRFPLRENIPIPYCNIYICRYVHVSELFHVVSTFISVNSCTLFNSLKQLEQLMYLAVCKWLKGSQIALLYCGDSCKDELYFLGNYIWNLFGIWMWNNEIFASPSLFSSPSVTHPILYL